MKSLLFACLLGVALALYEEPVGGCKAPPDEPQAQLRGHQNSPPPRRAVPAPKIMEEEVLDAADLERQLYEQESAAHMRSDDDEDWAKVEAQQLHDARVRALLQRLAGLLTLVFVAWHLVRRYSSTQFGDSGPPADTDAKWPAVPASSTEADADAAAPLAEAGAGAEAKAKAGAKPARKAKKAADAEPAEPADRPHTPVEFAPSVDEVQVKRSEEEERKANRAAANAAAEESADSRREAAERADAPMEGERARRVSLASEAEGGTATKGKGKGKGRGKGKGNGMVGAAKAVSAAKAIAAADESFVESEWTPID